MNQSKLSISVFMMAVICMAMLAGGARGLEVKSGDDTLNVDGRLQLLGALESVDDPWSDSERLFLFLSQARLNVNGVLNECEYSIQWMLGGEEVPERNSVMSLLDAYVDIPMSDNMFRLKIGQFRVPYSRERLVDSGAFVTTGRSIQNSFFNLGRDVGAAIHTSEGLLNMAVGVFTGGGINIPERYLPEDLELPMTVARIGINTGVDKDVFTPASETDRGEGGFAAFVNAAYTKDSRVGHSTPLNVKYYDRSLMLEPSWNPYISARNQKAEFYQFGVDVATQLAISDGCSLLLSGEYNVSDFSNSAGDLQSDGGVVSAALMFENLVIGLRYAVVSPDSDLAYVDEDGNVYPITDSDIHEITPSLTYSFPSRNVKVIADVTYQMDVPVSLEADHGVYNLARQPDQVSYAASGGIELQDNYLASLIVQYDF